MRTTPKQRSRWRTDISEYVIDYRGVIKLLKTCLSDLDERDKPCECAKYDPDDDWKHYSDMPFCPWCGQPVKQVKGICDETK